MNSSDNRLFSSNEKMDTNEKTKHMSKTLRKPTYQTTNIVTLPYDGISSVYVIIIYI